MDLERIKNRYINIFGAQILKDLKSGVVGTIGDSFQTETFNNYYNNEIDKYYYKQNNKLICKYWNKLCKIDLFLKKL